MPHVKHITVLALCLLVGGCGTVSSVKGSQQTDFVLISISRAGGAWKLIRGETSACKLTTHGITGLEYTIDFDGVNCEVTAGK